jgi:hypothetical protein
MPGNCILKICINIVPMKATRMFPIVAAMLFLVNAYGDVIPENTHYVSKCIRITNLSDYPGVSLLGFGLRFGGSNGYYSYLISDSACLYKEYKLDDFHVYAVQSSYLEGKDVENLELQNDPDVIRADAIINPSGEYYDDSNPVSSIEQFWEIIGFTDSTVVLFKWKEISGYNDGTPSLTDVFNYEGDTSLLSQEFPTITARSVSKVNEQIKQNTGIVLYPNPGKDFLTLKISNEYRGAVYTDIFSIDGQAVKSSVFQKTNFSNIFTVSTGDLGRGTYIVRMRFGDTTESTKLSIYR